MFSRIAPVRWFTCPRRLGPPTWTLADGRACCGQRSVSSPGSRYGRSSIPRPSGSEGQSAPSRSSAGIPRRRGARGRRRASTLGAARTRRGRARAARRHPRARASRPRHCRRAARDRLPRPLDEPELERPARGGLVEVPDAEADVVDPAEADHREPGPTACGRIGRLQQCVARSCSRPVLTARGPRAPCAPPRPRGSRARRGASAPRPAAARPAR